MFRRYNNSLNKKRFETLQQRFKFAGISQYDFCLLGSVVSDYIKD